MVRVKDIVAQVNLIAPFDMAQEWDNCGLQVGHPEHEVLKVLIALDVSLLLIETAVKKGVNMIITHHPLLISPVKSIDFSRPDGRMIYLCAQNDISIVSAHTNLDIAREGLNDYFAGKIGIKITRHSLSPSFGDFSAEEMPGIGRIGRLEHPMALKSLVDHVKACLGINHIRVTGNVDQVIETAAVCTGSGGSLVGDFLNSDADVFITGDVKYHEARNAEEHSKSILDVGHFASEHIAIDLLYEQLTPKFKTSGVNFICYKEEKDPFIIV